MVNGSRYYRALESDSIASSLSSALTNGDSLNSNFLQLGWRSGSRPQRTVYPRRLPVNCDTHYVSRHRTHNLPIVSPTRYQPTISRATERMPLYSILTVTHKNLWLLKDLQCSEVCDLLS